MMEKRHRTPGTLGAVPPGQIPDPRFHVHSAAHARSANGQVTPERGEARDGRERQRVTGARATERDKASSEGASEGSACRTQHKKASGETQRAQMRPGWPARVATREAGGDGGGSSVRHPSPYLRKEGRLGTLLGPNGARTGRERAQEYLASNSGRGYVRYVVTWRRLESPRPLGWIHNHVPIQNHRRSPLPPAIHVCCMYHAKRSRRAVCTARVLAVYRPC